MAGHTWEAMSLERRRAAKCLLEAGFYRDSVSRSYYAAYCAATGAVIEQAALFCGKKSHHGFRSPSHEHLPDLIMNVRRVPVTNRRIIKRLLRNLRHSREDADYRPYVTIPRDMVLSCIHNAISVQTLLEVREDGTHSTTSRSKGS